MSFEWNLDGEYWRQDGQGAFNLVRWGKITPQQVDVQLDDAIASHVGARRCLNHGFFPSEFSHCPKCGKPMREPPRVEGRWWPPRGDNPTPTYPRVFGEVTGPLSLMGWGEEKIKQHEMSLPAPGDYRFLVGEFGTLSSAMIALNIREGRLHCLETAGPASRWCELKPESQLLGHWEWKNWRKSLAWGVSWWGDGELLLPTDEGLMKVWLDLINRCYKTELLAGHPCIGSPSFLGPRLFVPTTAGLFVKFEDEGKTIPINSPSDLKLTDYCHPPLIEEKRLIWLNNQGQLIVEGNGMAPRYIPWPAEFEPCLNLATAYFAPDGKWWQLGCNRTVGKYFFLQLDGDNQLIPTDGPRQITGRICVYRDRWSDQEIAPWLGIEGWSIPQKIQGARDSSFHPLLYSGEEIIGLLRGGRPQDMDRLILLGRRKRRRHPQLELGKVIITDEPCLGQFVVYDRKLYFYYPGWEKLTGWTLQPWIPQAADQEFETRKPAITPPVEVQAEKPQAAIKEPVLEPSLDKLTEIQPNFLKALYPWGNVIDADRNQNKRRVKNKILKNPESVRSIIGIETASPALMHRYWLVLNGKQSGPHRFAQIKVWLIKGRISAKTLAWRQGLPQQWLPIRQIPEFAAVLFSSATPKPPPVPSAE